MTSKLEGSDISETKRCRVRKSLKGSDISETTRCRGRKSKHSWLPWPLKLEVIKLLKEDKTQHEIAKEVGISQPLVSRIFRYRSQIITDCFDNQFHKTLKCRRGKYFDLDSAMTEWYLMAQAYGLSVSTRDVLKKAEMFSHKLGVAAGFKGNTSWFNNWKAKNNVVISRNIRRKLPRPIEVCKLLSPASLDQYDRDDIYAVSEVAMSFRSLPGDATPSSLPQDQLTILVACNCTCSDKCRLFVVGNSSEPMDHLTLPCDYMSDSKSWMGSDMFTGWLLNLDNMMKIQKRKIVLILNKVPIHPPEAQVDLTNIKLMFVEDEVVIHPVDNGISQILKHFYRRELVQRMAPDPCITTLDALHMLNKSWLKVEPQRVRAVFMKAKFLPSEDSVENEQYVKDLDYFMEESVDVGLECFGPITDAEICTKLTAISEDEECDPCLWDLGIASPGMVNGGIAATNGIRKRVESTSDLVVWDSLSELRRFLDESDTSNFQPLYDVETLVLDQFRVKTLLKAEERSGMAWF